jgi:hypothetical protein
LFKTIFDVTNARNPIYELTRAALGVLCSKKREEENE